jgi:hypothetical protein
VSSGRHGLDTLGKIGHTLLLMDDDHHSLWRIVGQNFASLERNAPEGFEPVVELYLDTIPSTPILASVVETRAGFPWAMVHSIVEGRDEAEKSYPSDRYVFVDRERIARVEIRYVLKEAPTKQPFGFRVVDAGAGYN